jgi:hypothetical protein
MVIDVTEEGLVNIVMQDLAKPASVFMAEITRECLGEGVTNRIGMSLAFAFDDFHGVFNGIEL